MTLEVTGFGPVLFCHGTPRSVDEVVLVDTRLSRWAEALTDVPPQVRFISCGHTHMAFVRHVDHRVVLNPGSIGMPYGRPGGNWALLRDGGVALRHTPLDLDIVCARIVAESTYPEREAWVAEFVRGANSDVDAMIAFAPRDGRTDAGGVDQR